MITKTFEASIRDKASSGVKRELTTIKAISATSKGGTRQREERIYRELIFDYTRTVDRSSMKNEWQRHVAASFSITPTTTSNHSAYVPSRARRIYRRFILRKIPSSHPLILWNGTMMETRSNDSLIPFSSVSPSLHLEIFVAQCFERICTERNFYYRRKLFRKGVFKSFFLSPKSLCRWIFVPFETGKECWRWRRLTSACELILWNVVREEKWSSRFFSAFRNNYEDIINEEHESGIGYFVSMMLLKLFIVEVELR